jgi:NAD(P)H-quinone oxidoreductase subunit I
MTEEYELAAYDRHELNYDSVALGRLPYKVTDDPMVRPIKELAYLPKGETDGHNVSLEKPRAGSRPEHILEQMEEQEEASTASDSTNETN